MKRLFRICLTVLLTFGTLHEIAFAQQSENMSLVSHMGFGRSMHLALQGNTLFFNEGSYLVIVDVSSPASPVELSRITMLNSIMAIAISGNYAYVSYGAGVAIVDITNPSIPFITGFTVGYPWINGISVLGDYAYVVHWEGLSVIDVTDKANPVRVSDTGAVANGCDIKISGNLAYVSDGGDWSGGTVVNAGLRVFDLIDPINPAQIGYMPLTLNQNWTGRLTIDGTFVYFAAHDQGLFIIDVANPAAPFPVSNYVNGMGNYMRATAVFGNYLAVANSNMLDIVDITDPANPSLAGWRDAQDATDVFVTGDYAFTAEWYEGLRITDISNPTDPQIVAAIDVLDSPTASFVYGDYLYVATNQDGLRIFDNLNPSNPFEIGFYDPPDSHLESVFVTDLNIYTGGGEGLYILDKADPASPQLVGRYNAGSGNTTFRIYVDESTNTAYLLQRGNWDGVTNIGGGLHILNISDKANPVKIGEFAAPDNLMGMFIDGDFAYITIAGDWTGSEHRNAGLYIVDISNPALPQLAGVFTTTGYVQGVHVSGNLAYIASQAGLYVVDISDPSQPFKVGFNHHCGDWLTVAGNYLYQAAGDGFRVFDITIPTYPIEAGYYYAFGGIQDIQFANNIIYGTGGGPGVMAVQFFPPEMEYPLIWDFTITLTEGTESQNLTVGVHPDASEGIDDDLGEIELPPLPVAGVFDVRFTEENLGNGLHRNFVNNMEDDAEWVIDIQRAAGGNVTFTWPSFDHIEGSFFLVDINFGQDGIVIDMSTVNEYILTDGAITQVILIYLQRRLTTWNMNYPAGWNFVSVPAEMDTPDDDIHDVFPDAISVFRYEEGYRQLDRIRGGEGYWLNLAAPHVEDRIGMAVDEIELELDEGWSMIGAPAVPLPVSAIFQYPQGSILSIYRYDGGYQLVNTWNPGEGYWINLARPAIIILSSAAAPKTSGKIINRPEFDFSQQVTLSIETDFGIRTLNFYLGSAEDHSEINRYFELPPPPPAEVFDARIMKDGLNGLHSMIVPGNSEGECDLRLWIPQGNKKLIVRWDNSGFDSGRFILRDGYDGIVFSDIDMGETDILDLSGKPVDMLKFAFSGGGKIVDEFDLMPNYPNPFNPETTISYALKEAGKVRLVIYNILGQEVRTLVDDVRQAGRHSIRWDGKDNHGKKVSGGVYIYKLQTKETSMTRKMILLK